MKVKDFEIRSFRLGSRLRNGPEWAYRIYWHSPDGDTRMMDGIYYTKEAAKKRIREIVRERDELHADTI